MNNTPDLIENRRALEIVRDSYDADVVTRYFGWEFDSRQRRELETVPFAESRLEEYQESHLLVPKHPLATILNIRAKTKDVLQPQIWYDDEMCARRSCGEGWLLIRKHLVPDSLRKTFHDQLLLLCNGEGAPWACDKVYADILHYLVTGERLITDKWVRCRDTDSLGNRLRVGHHGEEGYGISIHRDDFFCGSIGIGSCHES